MTHALVGIGSNLTDPAEQLRQAITRLAKLPGLEILRTSTVVRSRAVGGPTDQPDFLNAAVLANCLLEPVPFVDALLDIERAMGRRRSDPWGPRIIDLDLLCLGDCVVATDQVVIPHPWMCVRSFVVKPCCEIAPDFTHPLVQLTMDQLWQRLSDPNGTIAVLPAQRQDGNWVRTAVDRVCAGAEWALCNVDGSQASHLIESIRLPSIRPDRSRLGVRALVVLGRNPPPMQLEEFWQLLSKRGRGGRAPAVSLAVSDAEDAETKLRVALAAITAVP